MVKNCHITITILAEFYGKSSRYEKIYWKDFCLPLKKFVIIFLFFGRSKAFGSLFRTEKKVVKLWDFNVKRLLLGRPYSVRLLVNLVPFSTIFYENWYFWPCFAILAIFWLFSYLNLQTQHTECLPVHLICKFRPFTTIFL